MDMGMDPQTAFAMDQWNQMLNQQAGVRVGPDITEYRHIVNSMRLNNPSLAHIPVDMMMRLMQKESQWDPYAVSPAKGNPRGLTQMKPSTATELWQKGLIPEDMNLYNPEDSIQVSMTYLDYLKRRYKGNWRKTLQMYNIGPAGYKKGRRNPRYSGEILMEGG